MSTPANPIAFPYPAPETHGRNNPNPGDNAEEFAKLIRPRGTKNEVPVATVARESLKLVDRTTGKAYSADEILKQVVAPTTQSIINPNVFYVRANGDNDKARPGREDLPYATMQGAVYATNGYGGTSGKVFDLGVGSFSVQVAGSTDLNIVGAGVAVTSVYVDGSGSNGQLVEAAPTVFACYPVPPDGFDDFTIQYGGGYIYVTASATPPEGSVSLPPGTSAQQVCAILGPPLGIVNSSDPTSFLMDYGSANLVNLPSNPIVGLVSSGNDLGYVNPQQGSELHIKASDVSLTIKNEGGNDYYDQTGASGGAVFVSGTCRVAGISTIAGNGPAGWGTYDGSVTLDGVDLVDSAINATSAMVKLTRCNYTSWSISASGVSAYGCSDNVNSDT